MNECYKILFKCISLYKIENHRLVAYATNGIKNNINDLIRNNLKNKNISGTSTLTIDNYIEETYKDDIPGIADILFSKYDNVCYSYAVKKKRYVLDKLFMYVNIYINSRCTENS